ncbi:TPA: nucleotidyltransferase family protein [Candidatus Woesearchaeota archaeon]|nr:nucleotidyltransferase family protein [Candidatus Woesearchaeota archaeon]HII65107.1 nucleotidyltransferase family protein [Candidatus Woesearchaeota archaeon]
MQAVILCGGKGTRMRHLSQKKSKVLLPLGGKSLLQRQIELLRDSGIGDIILCIGHQGDSIRQACGDGSSWGVRIRYAEEQEPLGTGGALRNAWHFITGEFLVLYGDLYIDMDMGKFVTFHRKAGALLSVVLHRTDHPWDSDLVEIDGKSRIIRICGKLGRRETYPTSLSKTSVYACQKELIRSIPAGESDLDKDIIPALLSEGEHICGYVTEEFIRDAGTPERYAEVDAYAQQKAQKNPRSPS